MQTLLIQQYLIVIFFLTIFFSPLLIGLLVMGPQRRFTLGHSASGIKKSGFYGYSWTYLFFGFLVPIFRGEIGLGMLHLVFSALTGGIFQVIMSYLYNKQFTQRQIMAGWVIADPRALDARARQRLSLGPAIIAAPVPATAAHSAGVPFR